MNENKFLDVFFRRDANTGERRLRLVSRGTMLALLVVIIGGVVTGCYGAPAALPPTPTPRPPTNTPVSSPTFTSLPTFTPSPTFTSTPIPTETPAPLSERDKLMAEINGCDPDPANWDFRDIPKHWNWKHLYPECALRGLERTATWYIAVRSMGLTFDEAAQALGFDKVPYAPSKSGWVPFATAGRLGFAPMWVPISPGIRQWKVTKDGTPGGITLTVRGCYRTRHEEGGKVVWWRDAYGFPFDAMCFLYEDFTSDYSVYAAETEMASEPEERPYRYPLLFAYSQDTGWVFLGRIYDKEMWTDPREFDLEADHAGAESSWGPLWTVERVQDVWEIPSVPLPEGWQQTDIDKVKYLWDAFGVPVYRQWEQENTWYDITRPTN